MEVEGQSEGKRLVEVKNDWIQCNGSGPGTCSVGGTTDMRNRFNQLYGLIRSHARASVFVR